MQYIESSWWVLSKLWKVELLSVASTLMAVLLPANVTPRYRTPQADKPEELVQSHTHSPGGLRDLDKSICPSCPHLVGKVIIVFLLQLSPLSRQQHDTETVVSFTDC